MRVVILFGSEMGTAERAAEAVADELARAHDVSIYDMSDFDTDDLNIHDFHVLVCSTYGTGSCRPEPSRSLTSSTTACPI